MTVTYDYHGQLAATKVVEGAVEAYVANAKALQSTGDALVADNTAEGVKSTMVAYQEKQAAVIAIIQDAVENAQTILKQTEELHVANGGEL